MKRLLKKQILVPVILTGLFLITTSVKNDFFEIAKQLEIFTTMFKEINMNYVDETNPGDLMDNGIKSMLKNLDPYTVFMNEQDIEAFRINNTGDYSGVGARIKTEKDKLIVIETYKDFPADKAGLKAGDEIIKIGDINIKGYGEDGSELLRGATGTPVTLTYMREDKQQTVTLKRADVEVKAVPYYALLNNNVGYIALSVFNEKASQEVGYALRDLKKQGANSVILDLRNNPGGLLNEAVNVVNLFVPKKQLVVTTKGKVEKYNKTYLTENEPIDTEIPLAVIIDGKSASSSEIVSGALQDLDRAVIVGSRSYGKGLVQRVKPLVYGTQIKITISRYYTPSGRCIQALDYSHKNENGDAVRVKQENYNAFKTKNGRKVFDGGGVLPDINFNEPDKLAVIKAIENNNLIFNYATAYYYKRPSVANVNDFKLNDSDFNDFKNYLNKNQFSFETETEKALEKALETANSENLNITTDYNKLIANLKTTEISVLEQNKPFILSLLTDEIVRRYAYREGLYEYYKLNDEKIKKAVAVLNNPTAYKGYLK